MPEDSAPRTKYLSPASAERAESRLEGGDHVEREALQLEPDIERDEIVGRDHHHHAGGGEQHEHRELELHALRARANSRAT